MGCSSGAASSGPWEFQAPLPARQGPSPYGGLHHARSGAQLSPGHVAIAMGEASGQISSQWMTLDICTLEERSLAGDRLLDGTWSQEQVKTPGRVC